MCIIHIHIYITDYSAFEMKEKKDLLHLKACGIFVPQPQIEAVSPAVEVQSPNHWTTGKVPPNEGNSDMYTTWMNLEDIVLNERSHLQKDKHGVIPLT